MPDPEPDGSVPIVIDPLTLPRFRVSGYFADDVHPPRIAGELAAQYAAFDELDRDDYVEQLTGRTDLQRILVEERVAGDFNTATTNSSWKTWRSWTLNDDGHGWSHS